MLTKKEILSLSFIMGFSVMVIELTATRIIAPIFGSSIYTWTSTIGVILLGTSIGNHIGGKIIDKKNKLSTIAFFLLIASVFILFISPAANLIDQFLLKITILWLSIILASLLFFFIPSFILGAIYPMLAKQFLQNTINIGRESGTLSASLAVGSILGTFLTGFIFIGYLGSFGTLFAISLILFICSLWLYKNFKNTFLFIVLYIILLVFFLNLQKHVSAEKSAVFQKESNYYDIRVADKNLPELGNVRILFLDAGANNIESATGKTFDSYTNFYPVFSIFNKNIQEIAMIGGGSLELSEKLKNYYPNANVTTAEIDPFVTSTAAKYFRTSDYIIKNTVPVDGRMFLAQSQKKYDLIFSDAYNSFISIPWHLTTQEFFKLSKKRLEANGVFAINFISPRLGDSSRFFESMETTFSSVFENYYIFAYGNNPAFAENIVLVGINSDKHLANSLVQLQLLDLPSGQNLARHLIANNNTKKEINSMILLTDNFAPTDRLMLPIINKYFKSYIDFFHPET